jgi:hypothetical protein
LIDEVLLSLYFFVPMNSRISNQRIDYPDFNVALFKLFETSNLVLLAFCVFLIDFHRHQKFGDQQLNFKARNRRSRCKSSNLVERFCNRSANTSNKMLGDSSHNSQNKLNSV